MTSRNLAESHANESMANEARLWMVPEALAGMSLVMGASLGWFLAETWRFGSGFSNEKLEFFIR